MPSLQVAGPAALLTERGKRGLSDRNASQLWVVLTGALMAPLVTADSYTARPRVASPRVSELVLGASGRQ